MTDHTTKIVCNDAPNTLRQTTAGIVRKFLAACRSPHSRAIAKRLRPRKSSRCRAVRRRPYGTSWRAQANPLSRINTIDWHDRTPIHLPVDPRAPLVKVDTVIAIRAEQPYAIKGHVENGVLRWVFNVASNPDSPHRDLRFWTRELSLFASNQREHHAALRNTDVKFAVDKIIGTRHTFRTNDVCLLFNLTRPALAALRNELRPEDNRHYSRERLEQFLIRRLLK